MERAVWIDAISRMVRTATEAPKESKEALLESMTVVLDAQLAVMVEGRAQPEPILRTFGSLKVSQTDLEDLGDFLGVRSGNAIASVQVSDGEVLAVLRPQTDGEFSLTDQSVLRTMGDLASGLRPHQALESLYSVATELMASRDLDTVFLEIANAASSLMQAEMGGILLEDKASAGLVMKCAVGHKTMETAKLRVAKGQGLAGLVYETGQAHTVEDWATDETITKEFVNIATTEGTRSAIAAPIRSDGRTAGVLGAWRRQRSVFTRFDVNLMSALADLAGVALERAAAIEAEHLSVLRLSEAHDELRARLADAERANRIHREFTNAAVDGAEVMTVLSAINEYTDASVGFVDDDLHVLAATTEAVETLTDSRHIWRPVVRGPLPSSPSEVVHTSGEPHLWHIRAPVRTAGVTWGNLILESEQEPATVDRVTLEHAATVCSLLLARQEAVDAAAGRVESEFVWDLLEGRVTGEADLIVHSRELSKKIETPSRVFLVEVHGDDGPSLEGMSAEHSDRRLRRLLRVLSDRMATVSPRAAMLARRGTTFVGIGCGQAADVELPRRIGDVLAQSVESSGLHVSVGVSGVVEDFDRYADAFRQAKHALSATTSERDVVVFEDLGVLQFLLAPAGGNDLDRFVDSVLGKLVAYDEARNSDLVGSLAAYLENSGNLQKAANALFIHHKTMRYRIKRIEEIAGLCMDEPEDRFNAVLALKINHLATGVLEPVESEPPPSGVTPS